MWQQVAPDYDRAVDHYQEISEPAASQLLDYLGVKDPPVDQIIVIPNLLDSYWRGYAVMIERTAYLVVGPVDTDLNYIGLMQHEMTHPVIGPMIEANLKVVTPDAKNRLYPAIKKAAPKGYEDWEGILEETLNKAIGLRLMHDPDLAERGLRREEANGFLLVRVFFKALSGYEASEQTMEEYMPTLLATLNTEDIRLP
jgi:hypothetical protein